MYIIHVLFFLKKERLKHMNRKAKTLIKSVVVFLCDLKVEKDLK